MSRMKLRAPAEKTEQFVMRLSLDDKRALAELADAKNVTAAEVIRSLIRREHARTIAR